MVIQKRKSKDVMKERTTQKREKEDEETIRGMAVIQDIPGFTDQSNRIS